MLSQLPLHLLVLILKGKNAGSSLLTLTISGLTIELNKFTLAEVYKNANPVIKHFILYCI